MSETQSPDLVLERRDQGDRTSTFVGPRPQSVVMVTPLIDEAYWSYRVRLTEKQAVVGFPKFGLIGIGFAVEEDWNTNLPSTCDTQAIADHIMHNKGDDAIPESSVIEAIRLIQDAVAVDAVAVSS